MRHNIGDLPALVRLAAEHGVAEVVVNPLGYEEFLPELQGEAMQREPDVVAGALMDALRLSVRLGVLLRFPPSCVPWMLDAAGSGTGLRARLARAARSAELALLYARRNGPRSAFRKAFPARPVDGTRRGIGVCHLPWTSTFVGADGFVYPCCSSPEKLGNLASDSWESVWGGPAYRSLRRTVNGWNPSAGCRRCPYADGIGGGDPTAHERFFGAFDAVPLPLDSPALRFGGGFHEIERSNGAVSHVWMGRTGTLRVQTPHNARFVRLRIAAQTPGGVATPGQCMVNGGVAEHFDNSCETLHFPVPGTANGEVTLDLEMEREWFLPPDDRPLALAVRAAEVLS
jgi:radical SAM protein with 4Fe4S-binding SPASM domain